MAVCFSINKTAGNRLTLKRIGRERENIDLQNDEFIGEFTQIIFDTRYNTIAIQSNRYGVGWNVVCKYLNYIQNVFVRKRR